MFGFNSDPAELYQLINNLEVDKDYIQVRKILRRILMSSTGVKNTGKLFPAVVKHLSSNDLVTKKLVWWFICRHGNNEELILLAVNTLVKDCSDSNPMIRGFSLKTLTSIPLSFLVDYSLPVVLKGFTDSSVYVRRTAILSSVSLFHVNHDLMLENGFIDKLYSMIRDSDCIVVTNALLSLEEILRFEGGIVINRNIAFYLLNKLHIFTESQLASVFMFLSKYKPSTKQEIIDIMNIIDPFLKSNNAFILVETIKYFIKLLEENLSLMNKVMQRVKDQLLHLITMDHPEMVFLLLEFTEFLMKMNSKELFQSNHRYFFSRCNEPIFIKVKKIHILSSLSTPSNLNEIVEELGMYSMDAVPDVAKCAVVVLGKIANEFPSEMEKSVEILINLLNIQDINILPHVLSILQNLNLKQVSNIENVLRSLETCSNNVEQMNEAAIPSLVWLLGEHGEHLDSSPYILERYIDELNKENDLQLYESLLTSTFKLFLKRPAECQDMLGKILEKCTTTGDVDLQYKVTFYYQLLKTKIQTAQQFFI